MSWKTVQISSFLTERKGRFKPDEANQKQLKRIEKIDFTGNIHLAENKPTKTSMILVKKGDLVISGINADKGAISIYQEKEDVMATIHYSSYTFDSNQININYFKWFLKSKTFLKILKDQTRGGIKTELKPKRLLPLQIDLPDLKTQEAILSKIEFIEKEYQTLLNELSGTISYCKKLKQSILQEAIQGKLTRDWRGRHPELVSGSNSAAARLENIKAEKASLVKEKKIKKEKPLPPILKEEIPFELPEGWVWCRLGDLAHTITKGSSPKWQGVQYVDKGILFITSENVGTNQILLKKKKFVEEKFNKIEPRSILEKGDVLTNIVGASIGRTAVWDKDFTANINQAVCLIRYPDHYYRKDLLVNTLNSDFGIALMMDGQFDTGRGNLSLGAVSKFKIPFPPLEEQKAIVAKVEGLMEKCSVLEQQVTQSEQHAQMLMQAVLKEAFQEKKQVVQVVN
ncbi:type I restriction enzyme, S subunit [Salinimicrobium catena]|uniref:Type I restriction enzyme, S subunit n=1 Tax=Salinimicrobium catena TaxID=390640 RepID=A0A1H5P5Q5_9FLAO|nr:restriction endonuclease subunit S [Salinimicrobium catena]SDL72367.1 type I restriction enzyme, S subunit [Salinimicrobium catena]SEF08924.1 type I restriction enzyme, S subunit [Salinimicrobium catena]